MLPRWYPNVINPADGNFIERHIEAIGNLHPLELIFVKGLDTEPVNKIVKKVYLNNVEVHLRYFKNRTGMFSSVRNLTKYLIIQFKAYKEISSRKGNPCICHVHVMARTSLLACWLKLKYRVPFIVSEHWSGYYPSANKLSGVKKFFYSIIFKYADQITAVSQSLGAELKKLSGNRDISIIPNIVEEVFFTTDKEAVSSVDIKNIVHISNLHPEIKRVDKIIQAFKSIRKHHTDINLIIIGSGTAENELKSMVNQDEDLKDNVHFLGDIPPIEVANVLKTAWTTVLFSKFETQSVVMLESIAMGVPVIAPEVGGISEHCEGRGILYKVNSLEAFTNSLDKMLIDNPKFRTSDLRAYAANKFKAEIVGASFIQEYDILKRPN